MPIYEWIKTKVIRPNAYNIAMTGQSIACPVLKVLDIKMSNALTMEDKVISKRTVDK